MTIHLNAEAVDRFFRFARERQAIYIRRRAGLPAPWTQDPILQQYRITNVYREQDKTTTWFRRNVRDPLRDRPEVLLATVLFRWFNTIRSGETIFTQTAMNLAPEAAGAAQAAETPWEAYLRTGDAEALRGPLRRQGAPWVTGAYMIRSPEGMDKLDGILKSVHDFSTTLQKFRFNTRENLLANWGEVAHYAISRRESGDQVSLESVWLWLKQFYGMGPFLAYEVVTDLRWTALLDRAPDVMTWANPGPGALRGARLLTNGAERGRKGRLVKGSYDEAHAVMARLLELSRTEEYWPQESSELTDYKRPDGSPVYEIELTDAMHYRDQLLDVYPHLQPGDWRPWEMREPEMWLCEFAKYERTRLGFGRPRGTFSVT